MRGLVISDGQNGSIIAINSLSASTVLLAEEEEAAEDAEDVVVERERFPIFPALDEDVVFCIPAATP